MLPDVPTSGELGLADFASDNLLRLFAAAGTPAAAIQRLNDAASRVLAQPALVERMSGAGNTPAPTTPAEGTALVRREHQVFGEVIRAASIRAG